MNHRHQRLFSLGLLGLAAVLFLIIAFGGLTLLASKSQKLIDLKQASLSADAQASSLASSKKQVEQYAYFNNLAKSIIPSDKDQAQAVLDIFNLAEQSGISIASVTFPASTLGAKAPTASGTDASTASSKTAISQAKPVEGVPGLYSLQLSITPQSGGGVPANKKVTYDKFLDFLQHVEHNQRTAQITQVNIQPQSSDQTINFTLTINIFMKP